MTRRFRAVLRRPMKLESASPLSRIMRHAVYSDDAPPTQSSLWVLMHDLRAAIQANQMEWLYKDWLHVRIGAVETKLAVDMRNSQFIGADTTISHFALGYEPDIALAIDALVPDDGTLVDVGANWGYFPVSLAGRPGFRGRIVAIEPFPSSYAGLETIVAALQLGDRVETLPVAIGREVGEVSMTDEVFSGNNRVAGREGVVRVSQTTLDLLAGRDDLSRIDFIKIDVEGGEADVIAGAAETIRRCAPAIMFEDWLPSDGAPASTRTFDEISRVADYSFHVIQVSEDPRKPAARSGERVDGGADVRCLVDVSEIAASDRDRWPERINVLALPAGNALLDRLAEIDRAASRI